jgi:Fe-Mn family superoxide dismutase
MKNHFTLYQGYVNNTNKLADTISAMVKAGNVSTPEFAELKRRFGWEFNGMRLHELFFRCLSKEPKPMTEALKSALTREFGSVESWEKELKAICTMRGIGWGVLYYDISTGRLFNCWINEHDVGHLSTCAPILIIDVFEHAFMIDYGLKRADYVEAVFKNINYAEVEKLFSLVGGK